MNDKITFKDVFQISALIITVLGFTMYSGALISFDVIKSTLRANGCVRVPCEHGTCDGTNFIRCGDIILK